MHINGFHKALWDKLRAEAGKTPKEMSQYRIIATDIGREAVEAARKNAAAAGIAYLIEFVVCGYADTVIPAGEGILMLNPEYGERMGMLKELESVYAGIGDFFKRNARDTRAISLWAIGN